MLQLTNISVGAGNPAFGSVAGVLFNNLQTTLIACPAGLAGSYVVPNNVTTIGDSAFQKCTGLTNVTLPNSVTSIEENAFRNCTSLTAAYFQGNAPPDSGNAFYGDNLATVYYLTGTAGWGATFGGRPTVQWAPRILTGNGLFGVQAGHFGFTFMGLRMFMWPSKPARIWPSPTGPPSPI